MSIGVRPTRVDWHPVTVSSAIPTAAVVIPAHNESAVIGDLLRQLSEHPDLHIVVACNGCTDDTAAVARAAAPRATVLEIAEASKNRALEAGDSAATAFPRLYVDGDVVFDRAGVDLLVAALAAPGIHAVAPERRLDTAAAGRLVRAYLDVWQTLPAVRDGLYGRGVLAVDEDGHGRITPRPPVMGDDLYVHRQFGDDERLVVPGAISVVKSPRTLSGLIARRTRAALGNTELGQSAPRHRSHSSTRAAVVFGLRRPLQSWKVLVFVGVTVTARMRARQMRRTGQTTWLRDETSRGGWGTP